jgi:hypothetical protein
MNRSELMDNHIPPNNIDINDDSVIDVDTTDNDATLNDATLQEEKANSKIDYENRRQHLRSTFTYPVDVNVFSNKSEYMVFKGYLRDVSMSGACLDFEDKYGRCKINEIKNTTVKISFCILEKENVDIFAQVKWIEQAYHRTMSLKMGIEFKYMESWDAIDKLIGMKNKDRNMIWNLWEQFFKYE